MHVQSGSNFTETYSELSCTIITPQATLCIRKQPFMAPPHPALVLMTNQSNAV
jgi:hypothetical protein